MGVTASDVQVEVNGDAPTGLRTEEATGRTYFYISYPLCTSLDECLGRKNDIRFIVADDKGSFTTSVPFIHAPFFVAVSPNSYDRSRGADVGVTLSLSEDYRGIHPISITATDRNAVISGATFDRVAKTVFFRLNCAECELGSLGLSPELPTLHPSDVLGSRYFMVIERGDRTPKSGNGLAWEWIVLIVVVPLVVVAVVVYIVLKRRAKARRSEAMAFQAHLYASHGYSDDGYLPA